MLMLYIHSMQTEHYEKGSPWHDEWGKLESDAYLVQLLKPFIIMEVATAAQVTAAFGYKIFFQERVNTFEAEYSENDMCPVITPKSTLSVAKFQTLEATDIPLLEGKEAEETIHPLMQFQRKFAGDESIQLSQITWDIRRPGILSFAGIRPQMTDELKNMGTVMAQHGYKQEFLEYAHYYNNIRKGYVSLESMIGFAYKHGTIDYYMARYHTVKEYWKNASPELDKRLVLGFMAIGYRMRFANMHLLRDNPTQQH